MKNQSGRTSGIPTIKAADELIQRQLRWFEGFGASLDNQCEPTARQAQLYKAICNLRALLNRRRDLESEEIDCEEGE